jgi:hypothetical protein
MKAGEKSPAFLIFRNTATEKGGEKADDETEIG